MDNSVSENGKYGDGLEDLDDMLLITSLVVAMKLYSVRCDY